MNPRDFLDVADELAGGLREADWRSAASRAYYAAFHLARAVLRQCGFSVPQGEQAHVYLSLRLANSGHPDIVQAGHDLNYLRTVRNRADYDLDRSFDHRLALDHVQLAAEVIRTLEELLALTSALAQVTNVIRVYERDVLKQVTWQGAGS